MTYDLIKAADALAECLNEPVGAHKDKKWLEWRGQVITAYQEARSAGLESIIDALPDMVEDLVWHRLDVCIMSQCGGYSLIKFDDGYLVDYDDLSLGQGFLEEEAKAEANKHNRTQIMAAFGVKL